VVNFDPEWVAGFNRNGWQVWAGMPGRFAPESTAALNWERKGGKRPRKNR